MDIKDCKECTHCTYVRKEIISHVEDRSLFSIAMLITEGDYPRAEDLMQEALCRLLERPHLYVKGNFKGFMRIMMFRNDLNAKRKEGRMLYVDDVPQSSTPINMWESETPISRIFMEQITSTLNKNEQRLLSLLLEGNKHREISEVLGVNLNTISARIRRLYADLRENQDIANLAY